MASLRQNLKSLHNCLPNTDKDQPVDAEQALLLSGDIAKLALAADTIGNQLENTCSALFDANYGIITFLRKIVNDDKLSSCKLKILEFLPEFLKKAGKIVLPYAVALKDVCLWAYDVDKGARSRNAVLAVLLMILKLCSGSPIGNDLEPDKIIQKFFSGLAQASKISSTVQQNIFHLLGVIAETFPEYSADYVNRFQMTFCNHLRKEMTVKSKNSDFSVITGCLLGLNSLFTKFPCKPEESEEIFSHVRKAIIFNKDMRLSVPKAGLKIISNHAALFRIQFLNNYQSIYHHIKSWSESGNTEIRNAALVALDKFFQQVAKAVCDKMPIDADTSQARTAFLFFLTKFKDIFKLPNSRSVTVAIKGYGYFAAACKLFWNVDEVSVMFVQVLQRCEELFLSQSDRANDRNENLLRYLPSYMEALASILTQLDELPEMFQADLENLVVFLIENFPRVPSVVQYLCYSSIIKLLAALYPKASTFNSFVHKIVYQGILRTCSHDVPFAEDVTAGHELTTITYKSYIDFWTNLLNAVQIKELNEQGVPLESRQAITDAVYDEIVLSVLTIVAKLNLTCNKIATATDGIKNEPGIDDTTTATSNPIAGLRAANPKDFQILVNVIEFCRSLLPDYHVTNFTKWVYRFGRDITSLSARHPLVSGFYKLLATCLKLCSDTRYFRDLPKCRQEPEQVTTHLDERVVSFKLFSKFAVEITFRLLQYKEDLLASCLEVVLSLPSEVVALDNVLASIVPAVCMAFRLGPSYLPLAELGLAAIETWGCQLSHIQLLPLYREVLPLLNNFLKSSSRMDSGDKLDIYETKASKAKKSFEKLARTNVSYGNKAVSRNYVVADERIKLRIVRLLGSIGNDINRLLVSGQPDTELAVAWDSHQHLRFAVPFMDMKPVVYLDSFLPRVVDLACSSSNRQIKVTAAELFHALVLYTLGSSSSKSDVMQRNLPATRLYEKMIPAMLRLACDVDQVTSQLFEPLVMQTIHWFSNNRKGSDDVTALVDALMAGIVSATDSALRDFSGRCIREFVVWSIKQSSPAEQMANPLNTESLLEKIYGMSLHPNSFMRLGAALAFNCIYTVIREEAALVDAFIIEILYHFVESLALTHLDEEHLGAREQCLMALDHVERIVRVKAVLLNEVSNRRRIPKEIGDGSLGGVVNWLLRQCGRPETECRHRCMYLVYHLCAIVTGISSRPDYFRQLLSERGPAFFISIFEGTVTTSGQQPSLHLWPIHSDALHVGSQCIVAQVINWFDLFLAAMDCYIWVFSSKLLEPVAVFSCSPGNNSKLAIAFGDFLENVVTKDATEITATHGYYDILTPRVVDNYSRRKCTVVIRCLDFVQVLLESPTVAEDVMHKFTSSSFWRLVVHCVLRPLSVGFDMTDVEVLQNLPLVTDRLLKAVCQRDELVGALTAMFREELSNTRNHFDLFDQLTALSDARMVCVINMRLLVDGYVQLFDSGHLLSILGKVQSDCDNLVDRLLCTAWEMCTFKSPTGVLARTIEGNYHLLANCVVRLALRVGKNINLLMTFLMDDHSMTHVTSKSTVTRGTHFYVTYKAEVNLHLLKNCDTAVAYLTGHLEESQTLATNMLLGMLENLIASRELRKSHGSAINRALCAHWDRLLCWCQPQSSEERKTLVLHFMRKMFLVDSSFTVLKEFTLPFDAYLTLLVDKSTSLKFKSGVLSLLPFFTRVAADSLVTLKRHLCTMAGQHFPLKSHELVADSSAYGEYVHAFRRILSALQLSCSVVLFEFVIELTCIEHKHLLEDDIQDVVAAFAKRLVAKDLMAAINIPFAIFTNEIAYPADVRRSTLDRFCLPLLRKMNRAVLLDFFQEKVPAIMDIIQMKLIRGTEAKIQGQLVSKAGCFNLMEVLYCRATKDELVTIQSKVNAKFCKGQPTTGKELTQALTRTAHDGKKDQMQGVTERTDLRLAYQCAAYNALVAVIRCTQTEVKFYKAFLFTENIAKGEYLWDNLVDLGHTYVFEMEQDVPIEKRQILKNTRYEARAAAKLEQNSGDDDFDDDVDSSYPLTIRQLTTQNLVASSLAEDVSQFDFTSSEVHFAASTGDRMAPTADVTETRVKAIEEYVEMEMDDLNQHPCMATLGGLLQHLALKISPPPQSNEVVPVALDQDSLPSWMVSMRVKFVDPATHTNVKLLMARLIVNNANVFRPYGRAWLHPLMQFAEGGATGTHLNYFITDVVTTILSWRSVALPNDTMLERDMAGRLLEYLMRHAHHRNRGILRNNLEIIKTMVECWKTRLDIPYKAIYDNLCDMATDRLTNLVGIQLVGIVVSCGLAVFSGATGQAQFLRALAENMLFKSKEVYASAAEVCGLALKHLYQLSKSDDFPFHGVVRANLMKLRDTSPDKFLFCLHRVQASYPIMVDSFQNKVLHLLPRLNGIFQDFALEIVASRLELVDEPYRELKIVGLTKFLGHGDDSLQLIALRLVNQMLPRMGPDQIAELRPIFEQLATHDNETCRRLVFDALIWVHQNYDKDTGRSPAELELVAGVKSLLLLGLVDPNTALRLTVLNFWSDRLPPATTARMVSLITDLYLPSTEQHFLGYTTNLLLELTSKSPDFVRTMFEHPLTDCQFRDYSVSTSWRSRHASMVPLFVETPSSQLASQDSSSLQHVPQLRATQDVLEFAPTQDPDSRRPFNWLTQNTFDASLSVPMTASESGQSSLLFNRLRLTKPAENLTKKSKANAGHNRVDEVDGRLIRKRFVRSSDAVKQQYIRYNERLVKMREESVFTQKMAREAQVTMYRQYRTGDFPDILIPHSAIIAPLQALAQKDDEIARMLFVALTTGIFKEATATTAPDDWKQSVVSIASGLDGILLNTKTYNRAVMSFVLEIYYYNCDHFHLDLDNLTLALKRCGQSIGALLLEKLILLEVQADRQLPAKRSRHIANTTTMEKTLWIKLAELNKLQGNFEVTRAIFAHKISTQHKTREALEAEERQDYASALRKYEELYREHQNLGEGEGTVDGPEVDLWDGSMLRCYDRLTKWDHLCRYAQSHDNLDELWNDIVYQEVHLPYIVRGKLKLIMRGQDEQVFVQFLDASLLVSAHQQFLECRHAEELALLSVVQGDYNRGRHYLSLCMEHFLGDWCGLPQLNTGGHRHLLAGVQKLVEMEEFLNVMRDGPTEQGAVSLMRTWDRRLPISSGDTAVTGDIVDNRNLYMRQLELRCCQLDGDDSQMESETDGGDQTRDNVRQLSLECRLSLLLLCAKSACQLNNLAVAFSQMKQAFKLLKKLRDGVMRVKCYHAYAHLHLQESRALSEADVRLQLEGEEKLSSDRSRIKKLLDIWKVLDEKVDERMLLGRASLNLQQFDLRSRPAELLVEYLGADRDLLDAVPNDERAGFMERIGCASFNHDQVVDGLIKYSYRQLLKSTDESFEQAGDDVFAASQYRLAAFCDQHLRRFGDDKSSDGAAASCDSATEFVVVMTTNLLDAIKRGHQGAVQLFPRLLQLIEEFPQSRKIFLDKTPSIPCWMLLRWNAQLVALLDKPVAPAIQPLVAAMVQQYPHALVYPFRVSRKGFKFEDSAAGRRNQAAVDELERALAKLWLVDHFIQALEHLSSPIADFLDQRKHLQELFSKSRSAFVDGFRKVYDSIFVRPLEDTDIPVPYGRFKKKLAKNSRRIFEQKFGKDFAKLRSIGWIEFLKDLVQVTDQLKKTVTSPKKLRDYCGWLADFQQAKFGAELEVPGQYDGLCKPMPEYHTKIAKFGDEVLLMQSLRQPKRIVIYGNDYREYKMLIKNGEDLRTDQRIEQLFQIMNQIYSGARTADNHRELKIVTYQVIPINDRLGMLEWLDETMTLKEFLETNLSDDERDHFINGGSRYIKWLEKDFKLDYNDLVCNGNPRIVLAKYKEVISCVPRYLLKTAFLRMSSGLEAFLALRTHFVLSHAVLCISQYVLGIGDRHTSNSLVCRKTGTIIGIDFGHAFGSATQFLLTPELMPFRLTPQFLNLMEPMREHGLLEATMIHAMSALRANPGLLLSTMDVFIKEPTLDWIMFAKIQKEKTKMKVSETVDANWYPRQKIDFARRKLVGDNSAYIMKEELELGHKSRDSFSKLSGLCLGSKAYGNRKQFAAKELSVENQIACLLDHATDEYILAHTYRGWMAWM